MTVTQGVPVTVTASDQVVVTMSAFDAECIPSIYYSLNGGDLVKYQTPFSISQEGDTLLEVKSTDLSGNWETPQRVNVRIDSTVPHVTSDAATSYEGSATIHLTAEGYGSGIALFEARLDDEPTHTVTSDEIAVASTTPGSHVIRYFIRDGAGHTDSGSIAFFIEAVERSVTLTASVRELTYPTIVELVATASNPETTTARFQRRRVDLTAWEEIGTVSSTTGQFVFLDIPRYGYSYRALVGSTESSAVAVAVHVPLSKPGASASLVKAGRVLRLWGAIRPKHGAATAEIRYRLYWQKYNPKTRKWTNGTPTSLSIDPANDVNSDTSRWFFNLTTRTSLVGSWRVRFFHECPRHKASYSPWTTFAVVK